VAVLGGATAMAVLLSSLMFCFETNMFPPWKVWCFVVVVLRYAQSLSVL